MPRETTGAPSKRWPIGYLLGVHVECRLGALRFRRDDTSPFLDHQASAAPPITSLPELEAVSLALQEEGAEELPTYRQWIATLLAPGTSLGGSRPKANFRDRDDSLWIAKFPSADDRHDVGAWEHVVHELAIAGGIEVPTYRLVRFNHRYRTFCSKRFDRAPRGRRFFVSAMTLLERRDGEGGSYLEIAEFIQNHGARGVVEADLAQLLRRVLFNVLVGNTDDHLRNHGFVREATGWRLAPAFDLNPNPARRHHELRLDEASDEPDLDFHIAHCGVLPCERARRSTDARRIACCNAQLEETREGGATLGQRDREYRASLRLERRPLISQVRRLFLPTARSDPSASGIRLSCSCQFRAP